MTFIRIKKGYQLKIAGRPGSRVQSLPRPDHVGVVPEHLAFIKAKLLVKVGDHVNIGSPLFVDKRNPQVRFLSPGGGTVTEINFGPRRIITSIRIELDDEETYETFDVVSSDQLDTVDRKTIVSQLLEGGLWPFFNALPFRDIPNPKDTPPAIFVCLDSKEPFQPRPEVYLDGQQALFKFGLKIMRRLAAEAVHVSADRDNAALSNICKGVVTLMYSGNYPAGDPGVLLYHTKKSAEQNRCWFINGQDVLLVAKFFDTGQYPVERTIALAGSAAKTPVHLNTRMGVPLDFICRDRMVQDDVRYVVGGVFSGYRATKHSYLGMRQTALMLLEEGEESEFLAFVRPGFRKPSYSRTFLSFFNPSNLQMNCRMNGDERACIGCGYCANVCPVDILPQITYKSIVAEDVEEALSHGLLDCVECGLCSYVCPSKIELLSTFKQAKSDYQKELA